MNEVATVEKKPAINALIPAAKKEAIANLDGIVKESQRVLMESLSPMERAFTTAAAMKAMEDAITAPILADIKNLMDSPLGFKTDRVPGSKAFKDKGAYPDKTVKRVVIVALIGGAQLSGNEFNILVNNCYFTKEFMLRQILNWPDLKRFEMEIGAAVPSKEGNNTANMAGVASWWLRGEQMEVVAGREDDEGRPHPVITVNAYGTSGPDQLRGLGESKMLRRVFAKLTGLNLDDEDPADGLNPPIEGKLAANVAIEQETSPIHPKNDLKRAASVAETSDPVPAAEKSDPVPEATKELEPDPLSEVHRQFLDASLEIIASFETVLLVGEAVKERLAMIEKTDWSQEVREFIEAELLEAKRSRTAQIRTERANEKKGGKGK